MPLWWRQTAGLAGATALCALCLAAPVLAQTKGDGAGTDNERLLPNVYPADPVLSNGGWLREPYDPFFDVDWSVALRGSYTKTTSGERFDILVVPTVGLEHIGSRSAVNFDAGAEIVRPSGDGKIDVGALRLGLQTGYDLDSVTRLTANGNLSLTRATPGTPGLADNIAIAPQTISGGFDAGITRQFGKFNIGVTGAAQRHVYGETTLTTGALIDNSDQNYWALDSGLRVGFQVTPIFEVFGRAGLGRDIFDRPSAALLAYPNATDITLEGGVTGRWNDVLEITASTGVGLRRFDAAGLDEVVTQLYGAQVSFTPDPTWRMTAGFATTVAPPGPDAGGTTRVDYTANAEVAYTVNSWLALRALADWNSARFAGSTNTETGYGLGAGADYKVNAHTAVSADYGYDHSESSTNGMQDAHRVTVGVTLTR
ncbi:outer membrane beta-barrel protein [Devosia ginsengisoli]|uniref:outer membrane beta-barrel protein n=1 Tax=Devosia ginsengisoli TaxID=400770 RepID=UPI0026F18E1E|nr:outer membrane beta-barrel protein [Devosia ginsengisoli]MCR6671958.1 outer membrane beta-barrel protein [Devosia ginsengisoli]